MLGMVGDPVTDCHTTYLTIPCLSSPTGNCTRDRVCKEWDPDSQYDTWITAYIYGYIFSVVVYHIPDNPMSIWYPCNRGP